MPTIAILESALASQIAAGEVVERPSSALKELVENSLDAEASRIDIAIEGGGIALLSIRDDGIGMSRADAELCIERHATSKLRAFDELHSLGSYGFRGEALPSIASVSRFLLKTRRKKDVAGTQLFVDGGKSPDISEVGIAPGTHIEVRDLFYNVPARRKFLRSSGTESGHIAEVVDNAALSNAGVTFTLSRDGRRAKEWLRSGSLEERVSKVLGEEQLAVCAGERGPLAVEAFLAPPDRARAGSAGLKLFCNGRPVRDRALLSTIAQAYGGALERGRYPRGAVYIHLPKTLVDVNVHPQKTEVRFADSRAVNDATYQILSGALVEAFALPAPSRNRWAQARTEPSGVSVRDGAGGAQSFNPSAERRPTVEVASAAEPTRSPSPGAAVSADSRQPSGVKPSAVASAHIAVAPSRISGGGSNSRTPSAQGEFFRSSGVPAPRPQAGPGHASEPEQAVEILSASRGDGLTEAWGQLKFAAQVRSTYLLCEGKKGLYVVDQHAAAERVLFNKLRREYEASTMASQSLLFPLTLEVTPEQSQLLESRVQDFKRLGFDVRVHSDSTASLHTVPRLLQRASPERLIWDLVAELTRGASAFSDAVDAALSKIACHGAIRAGDVLSAEEANQLLKELEQAEHTGRCAHGRPILAFTPWTELERKVGRR